MTSRKSCTPTPCTPTFNLAGLDTGGAQTIARYKDTMVQNISWSPDGESIAWAEYDPKKEWRTGDVFVMSASGGDSEVLVNEALSPVWAPGAAVALQTSPSSAP